MDICIWVTEKCNLNCTYCYVNKKPKTMNDCTAELLCNYIINYLDKSNGMNNIYFHGGEPLTNYRIINKIISILKEKNGLENIRMSMTTNGTIFSPDMEEVLRLINISVSLDGDQKNHDLNRKDIEGNGSFEKTVLFINRLNDLNISFDIRMTVHPSNVLNFKNNFMYLVHTYNQLPIFVPDAGSDIWNISLLKDFVEQIKDVFMILYKNGYSDIIAYLYDMKTEYLRFRKGCSGGKDSIHIDAEGLIYPCYLAVGNEEFCIGNISDGINQNRVEELYQISLRRNPDCMGCGLENNCKTRSCKIVNKIHRNDYLQPDEFMCNYTRELYKMITELEHKWKK